MPALRQPRHSLKAGFDHNGLAPRLSPSSVIDGKADSKNHGTIALLLRVRRGFFLGQASNDVGGPIPGQDLRDFGPVTTFELPDLLGTALFRYQWRLPEPAYRNWRAIGFELQFIFLAILIHRGTGDAGNHS